jgi:16S rRNA (guanine966-N2)-methyltransferase
LADRVRQALFAILEPRLRDARILDLCAGSGAAGIEALSRGARHAQFVEISRRASQVIRRNVMSLGLATQADVQTADALSALREQVSRNAEADLIIADPPYDDVDLRHGILKLIGGSPSPLSAHGLLVLSGRRIKGQTAQGAPTGLRLVRSLTYGETGIDLFEPDGAEDMR